MPSSIGFIPTPLSNLKFRVLPIRNNTNVSEIFDAETIYGAATCTGFK